MQTKILEIRDEGTYFAVIAVNMNHDLASSVTFFEYQAQRYHLRRVGYPCDGRPNIAISHLSADGKPFWNNPYGWGGRTYPVAHKYIIENWDALRNGDVIDVQLILGETYVKKVSERFSAPI